MGTKAIQFELERRGILTETGKIHYQGGNYEFAMARAEKESSFTIPSFEEIDAGIVKWHMSVIRLNGNNKNRIADAAAHILERWQAYSDPDSYIFNETGGEKHSTITPIARRKGQEYEQDLVLRNNITSKSILWVYSIHMKRNIISRKKILVLLR